MSADFLDPASLPATAGTPTADASSLVPTVLPGKVPTALAEHPRYRIVELLGQGGMGAVYKAQHLLMDRLVALKVINAELLGNPAAIERFRREVKAAAKLTHPNIVTAYDAEQAGDSHFLVMEFVEGQSLARLLAEQGPLPVAQACEYARQAALGLQHAFEKGMVHRDVKPANLMLTPQGQVKVLDFGLARFAQESQPAVLPEATSAAGPSAESLTQVGAVMGTLDYIAPEQVGEAHTADIRADIYSLGCTLYDLLAGHPPFPNETALHKALAHVVKTARPLTELRKDVPQALAKVVARMMAKDPVRRYPTPAAVAQALAPFAAPRRRRRLLVCLGVLLICLGLAGAVYAPTVYRFVTNQGELVIAYDDPEAAARLRTELVIRDRTHGREHRLQPGRHDLPAGEYEVEALTASEVPLFTDKVVLPRGGRLPFTVSLAPGLALLEEEKARLQGTWITFSYEINGKPAPEHKCSSLVIKGDGWVCFTSDGRLVSKGVFILNPMAAPRWLDARDTEGANAGRLTPQIYRLEGDVLTICFSQQSRPAEFATAPGSGRGLSRARREPPAPAQPPDQVHCFTGHTSPVKAVTFSPNGRFALSGSGWPNGTDRSMRLWDVETGRQIRQFGWHVGYVQCVAFSPNGRQVASGSTDQTIRLFDTDSGKEIHRLSTPTQIFVNGVAFLPKGDRLFSGGDGENRESLLRLWDVGERKEIRRFTGHKGFVTCVAVSRDGRRALSGSVDRTVRLWDVERGIQVRCFQVDAGAVERVAFSPDGKQAAAGGADEMVRLWDTDTGAEVRRFTRHEGRVTSVAFSKDGTHLLSGSFDRTVRLWEVATGRQLHCFRGHTAAVWSVAFAPNGRHALSGSIDRTLRLWRLPP
jgi:uncharacterized protein (TIGR03067 family)